MTVTGLAYAHLWRLVPGGALRWLSALPALAYGGAVIFGASYAFHRLRRMGSTVPMATMLALTPLLLWMAKEALRIATVFPAGPSLYYMLNPLHVGIALGALGQLGIVEMRLRYLARREHPGHPGITPALVVATLLPWLLLVAMQSDQGVASYFTFLSGYSRLFEGHSLEYQ